MRNNPLSSNIFISTLAIFTILLVSCGPTVPTTIPSTENPSGQETAPTTAPISAKEFQQAIPTNPALSQQTSDYARSQAEIFLATYGVSLNPDMAISLDAGLIGGENGKLASTMIPAKDSNQYYKSDRLVYGSISIDNPDLAKNTGLNMDFYLIACYPNSTDCLAVPAKGDPIQIDSSLITLDQSQGSNEFPLVEFDYGSIGGCATILGVRVCIKIF